MKTARLFFSPLCGFLLVALVGCNRDDVAHYRVPKEPSGMAMPPGMGTPGMGMPSDAGTDNAMPDNQQGAATAPPSSSQTPSSSNATPGASSPAAPGARGASATGAPAPSASHPSAQPQAQAPVSHRPTGHGNLKWILPKGWTEAFPGGMRFATLTPPVSGRIDGSVVTLPGQAGGELANVNRWRGQIGLPPIDDKTLAGQRVVLKTKAGDLAVFDFTSTDQAKSRVIAGLITTPDGNTWFLKLTGEAGPVGQARPEFMRLMGSIHLD